MQKQGKFAFFDDNIKNFVTRIHDENLGDAFVVSTCNRTEIYTTTSNYLFVAEEYCKTIGVNLSDFLQFANIATKEEALNHLFRVAAGLESQIIGDFEIIGQIKKHMPVLKKKGKTRILFQKDQLILQFRFLKNKNETGISNGAASVSYAAVHYILNNQKRITEKNILLLGVGEIGQNTVENLVKHVYQPKIKIANRTQEKAAKISEKYNIPNIDYNDFEKELENTDILIVATGAKNPIINKSHLKTEKKF